MKPNIQIWDIDKVIPYEQNAKKHPKEQIERIAKSIKDFGWDQPIVVDSEGVIIKGHGRRLASISLGLKQVPVWVRDDLTAEQVRASRLADNRVAESSIDSEMFRKELETLEYDLVGLFDAKELEFAAVDLGALDSGGFVEDIAGAVDDQAAEVRRIAEESITKPVPLAKVLGFKHVAGHHQLALSRFMGYIEQKTGLKGDSALAEFAKQFV